MSFSYILDLGNHNHTISIFSGEVELPTSTGWSSEKTADFNGTLTIDGVEYQDIYMHYTFNKDEKIMPHIMARSHDVHGKLIADFSLNILIKPEINGADEIRHGTISDLSLLVGSN